MMQVMAKNSDAINGREDPDERFAVRYRLGP